MRRHGRVDANQAEIVAALRKVGAFVQSLADIGGGCPDLLVGYHGAWYLMEVKTASGTLTDDEREWHERALTCADVCVVRDAMQALQYVGAV